ncbi:MAG: hypothetical protein HXX10_15420 [Rhodoplanes sp.]|uniref:hypothetical protein n=1 Tax=Rhodoplanes sp. TaxID=1968906 RepID=UPI0017CCDDEE|nr:hypothetical protein [Rhodoplanes sp.]NVO15418.1 hypothetical protein [Rhodoplanes sp.]
MVVSANRLTELCQHIMLATWDRDMPDYLGRAYDAACMLHENIASGALPSPARFERTRLRLEAAWTRYEGGAVRRMGAIDQMVADMETRAA